VDKEESTRTILFLRKLGIYQLSNMSYTINSKLWNICGFCILPKGTTIKSVKSLDELKKKIEDSNGTFYLLDDWLKVKELERRINTLESAIKEE